MDNYTPTNAQHRQQLIIEVAQARNENANDVHIKYLTFGHLFHYDVARTAAMTYVRSGKACLAAEGIKSLVFRSGKMLYIRYIEQSSERCIIEVKRTDFPSDVPAQRFEYSFEDAIRAGNSNQLNYKKIPSAMLTARCFVKMARDYFSDVVAGYYSVDEMMDNENMNDHERAQIAAQSLGEEINLSSPPMERKPPSEKVKHKDLPSSLDAFKSVKNMMDWCEWNHISIDEVNQKALDHSVHLDKMTEYERSNFFYTWILQACLRRSKLGSDWWRNTSETQHVFAQLRDEFPALNQLDDRMIGKSLGRGDFWEAAKVSAHFTGEKLEEAQRVLKKVLNTPDANAASYLCSM